MTNKIIPAILLIFISLPAFSFGKVEKNPVTIYEKINPAIVTVDSQIQDGLSCGTGCIIDKSGVILTSAHVIDIGNTVVVTMSNGQNYDAKVLKHLGDNKDIALLKIDAKKDLKTVKLGDSAKVKVGQKVLAIGNPFGYRLSAASAASPSPKTPHSVFRSISPSATPSAMNPPDSSPGAPSSPRVMPVTLFS